MAYDTAKPTKSLGHLNNYIKKSNNQKELKEAFKMIEETLKNNESNKELDDVSPSDIFINEVYDFYESNILDIIQFYIDSRSTGILSRKMQDAYLQSRGLEFDDLSNTLKEIIRTCRISKDYIYVNLAKHLKQLGFDRRSLTGDIYKFTDKTGWQYIPKDEFNTFLNNKFGENITDLDINKTLDCLNTLPKPQYNIVQFLNGQYNMETHEFKETDKDTFTLLNIPYEYNAEAKLTLLCEFLNKSLPNYELKQIFEVIGYLFTSGNERQIMVWLTSTGGGGKSVLANILRAIFHNQTCNVDLADFGRFDLGAFTHSHLNICSEIDNKATAKAKHYKNLTGNDPLKVEIKFKDPIVLDKEEVPKNIQVCNNMPNFDTLDNPLLQRFLIIEFPKRFRNTDEQIKGLDDKIIESKEDMEWLIYQSLQAHKTMCKENKDFAIRLSEEETRKRVVANNNPLIPAIDALVDFNDEFGIMKTSSYIIADEFKEILDMWIKENGLNVIHDKTGTINNKAIINSIKTNFDIWDETWRVKDDDIKELHYTTNRKTVNGKQQRVFPFLEKTEKYKELKAKWQAPKLSGKQNKKHTENPIKENKPHELAYIESEDNPNQPQQKELI